jgi:hypothetical protein
MKHSNFNYRNIYIKNFGSIPKDDSGRTYDIHHIDGNKENNNPNNLVALSIEKHYDIHEQQGDWGACLSIARRMSKPPEEISAISSRVQYARIANGTNPLVGTGITKKRVIEGTHNFLGSNNPVHNLIKLGKHNFQDPELIKIYMNKKLETGTHNFLGETTPNKNMPKIECPRCGKIGGRNQMKRWHFVNCSSNNFEIESCDSFFDKS